MKKMKISLILLLILIVISCKNRSENAKEIVNEFLIEINSENYKGSNLTDEKITTEFRKCFVDNYFFISKNWVLNTKSENDSIIVVESKYQTLNSDKALIESFQTFYLKNENEKLKIYDSDNLITNYWDFEVIGIDWELLTDIARNNVFKNIRDNMTLKKLEEGHQLYFGSKYRVGKLKIINNSEYDVKGVNVLIEHFNNTGKIVNTDFCFFSDIIRKKGDREKEWNTGDCYNCEKQKFKINFIKEN